jgi:phosphotransferase system HPr (HPr) family protein
MSFQADEWMEPQRHTDSLFPLDDCSDQTERTLADESRTVIVPNTQGLHARPVMRFVDVASQFQCRVLVRKGEHVVDGKNPMEMMLLEATKGTELEIVAEGDDSAEALDALVGLVESGFNEA